MKFNFKDKFKSAKEDFFVKRKSEGVIERAIYYKGILSFGLTFGIIVGIVLVILQSTVSHDTQQLVMNIIFGVMLTLDIAGNIYLLLPLFHSDMPLWTKIVRPILGVVLFAAIFVLGIYAVIVLLAIVFLYFILKIFLNIPIFERDKDEEKKQEPEIPKDDIEYKLDDGVRVKQDGFLSYLYHGDDGHDYEKSTTSDEFKQIN